MSIPCSIIRDLLPLYAEQMVSEETAALVKQHLSECIACAAEYATLQSDQEELRGAFREHPFEEESVPLKKVKRRLFRKNVLIAMTTAIVVIALFLCQIVFAPIEMDYGISTLYSHAEMDHAATAVKLYLGVKIGWCKLLSVHYAGDESSCKALKSINTYDNPDNPYTDCIVFDSTFRAPPMGLGNLSPSEKVSCPWIIARRGHGPWIIVHFGEG